MATALRLSDSRLVQMYFNRRALTILFLGFSSGLPLVLVASTLQAWYTTAGVSLMTIGALSLVGQPYIWKFLWAPIFDRYQLSSMGRRRSWILLCQIGIVITLGWMAFQDPKLHPWILASLAIATAFCSASQDTVIDAYRTDLMPDAERGVGAAMTALGYRVAMLVAGALGLVIAHSFGWRVTYLTMALLMCVCALTTIKGPKPQQEHLCPMDFKEAVIMPFLDFIRRPGAWMILAFIFTYKLSDALALALNTYFLLHFLNFSLIDLGAVTKVAGLTGVLLGSIVGGSFYPRLGLFRSLMYFGILQATSALLFALLTVVGKYYSLMAISIFGENFCSGLSSVVFIVYLTRLCNTRYTATQYALFSAVMAFGRVYIGPFAALLVKQVGWFDFYLVSFVIGFVPLIILLQMKKELSL